jgi:hypothetical protein
MVQANAIGWQEAVARLAGERTRAETCTGLLKKHGGDDAISRGALAYGEAKAEVEAVIAGLVTAIAAGKKPTSLPDLEARLERGIKAREVFCAQVMALVPDTSGERDGLKDVLGAGKVLTSMIEAVKELVLRWADEDSLTRKTIQTQLEAATWRDFIAIPHLP